MDVSGGARLQIASIKPHRIGGRIHIPGHVSE
jgi:hypothetical protein